MMRLGGDPRGGRLPQHRPQDGGWPGAGLFGDGIEIARGIKLSAFSLAGLGAAIVAITVILGGFGGVEVTEYALNYSLLTRMVEKKPYTSGRYWISPFNYFIKFPAVVKTIQFSDSQFQSDLGVDEQGDPMLRSRTSDGLDVHIELSFQYQLKMESIYDLYTTLGEGDEFHKTYVRIAIDRLTEIATEYTANQFFTERTAIGKNMEKVLRDDFEQRLYATVHSFQLRAVSLPKEFESAIQRTEVMKQERQVAEAEQNSTRVSMETLLMQATRRTQVRDKKANAYAQSVMLENTADIEQFTVSQEKAADSYGQVLSQLDSSEPDLLKYVQSRVIRDHPSDKMTVGLSLPSIS